MRGCFSSYGVRPGNVWVAAVYMNRKLNQLWWISLHLWFRFWSLLLLLFEPDCLFGQALASGTFRCAHLCDRVLGQTKCHCIGYFHPPLTLPVIWSSSSAALAYFTFLGLHITGCWLVLLSRPRALSYSDTLKLVSASVSWCKTFLFVCFSVLNPYQVPPLHMCGLDIEIWL